MFDASPFYLSSCWVVAHIEPFLQKWNLMLWVEANSQSWLRIRRRIITHSEKVVVKTWERKLWFEFRFLAKIFILNCIICNTILKKYETWVGSGFVIFENREVWPKPNYLRVGCSLGCYFPDNNTPIKRLA